MNNGSVVASETGTGGVIPGRAKIADGDTNIVGIEIPSFGALCTNTRNPDSASNVGGSGGIGLVACAVDDLVALIALLTDTLLEIELLACSLDLTADTVFIEIVVLGALDTRVTIPDPAAKVVIKLYKESGIAQLRLGELELLCGRTYEEEDQ